MKVNDLVKFSKERCFYGAVQAEWFYDDDKVKAVSESYVFHGPKYFGVSDTDVDLSGHKLIDTASFALKLSEKLSTEKVDNSFVMTIAGYGAGKSHLAVCLAALFAEDTKLKKKIIDNISSVDKNIADIIVKQNTKQNFVIVLNGMNNFNLDFEVLKSVRLTLEKNDISDDVLRNITKSYDIARQFVENTFSICTDQFEAQASIKNITYKGEQLKKYLLDNIEADTNVIDLVNCVYQSITGDTIQWDRGLSAGDIINEVYLKLCGEGKQFNKLLIIFDEFGRYIEYAAANPTVAGEAALQQIFETVQNANGGIIFTGFVQNELDAYLSRIEKTSNIIRYVGRYKSSENLFLSSNFETILANLIEKKDSKDSNRVIDNYFSHYQQYHNSVRNAIVRWNKNNIKKSVWNNNSLYESVIMRGCYPIHPITVWLLSNMSNWMQQRSSIAFVSEMISKMEEAEIDGLWLPYIYPINIIDSGIYNEMLNSEEKGLVQSQYCMLYRDIQVKIGDKLSENEQQVLKAVLIINIGRFSFANKEDAITAIRYCSNLKEETIKETIKNLENLHGVISFDETTNTFDMIAEANGFNEFKRIYYRYRMSVDEASIYDCDDTIKKNLMLLSDVDTSFSQLHNISSVEWRYKKSLVDSKDISEESICTKLRELENDYSGEGYRGEIVFAYCSNDSENEIARLIKICKKLHISNTPYIIVFLDDIEGEIVSNLKIKKVLNRFSSLDYERFQKHVTSQLKNCDKKIISCFNSLVQTRSCITEEGLIHYNGRINNLCSSRFESIYKKVIPFMFDGFESKTPLAAKRYLINICTKLYDRTLMNIQSYNALSTDEKNRIKSCLLVGRNTSWQVYDNSCRLSKPQDERVLEVFNDIEKKLSNGEIYHVFSVLGKYTKAPYGMNVFSIVLFFFYYIAYKDKYLLCFYGDDKLKSSHISDVIFKGNKLQLKEFLKIKIQINLNVDVDIIKELCEEVLACTSVENCNNYKIKLNELLVQEGTTSENQLLVASALARLDEGIALCDSMYEKLSKGQEIVKENKNSFSIQKFARVFTYFIDTSELVSPVLPFIYSETFIKQMDELKKNVDTIINKCGEKGIKTFTCNITQLSQYKKAIKSIAVILRDNKYENFAELIEKQAIKVEEDLLAKQKYQAILVDFDKDIATFSDVSKVGYSMCLSYLDKIDGWTRFFDGVDDIPEDLLNSQLDKISNSKELIKKRIDDISMECKKIIECIDKTNSIENLLTFEEKLNSLVAFGLSEEDGVIVRECIDQISMVREEIYNLPNNIDELKEKKNKLELANYGHCKTIIFTLVDQKLSKMLNEQKEWVERTINPVLNMNGEMSVVDCSNWLDKTSVLPIYIETEVMNQYKEARSVVETQLHKGKVQGVYLMYEKLSNDEKEEFKKMIE